MTLVFPARKAAAFLLVGSLGFGIDLGILLLLVDAHLSAYLARPLSMLVAMTATWLLNRRYSFGTSGHKAHKEYIRYGVVTLGAALINYAIYAACLKLMPPAAAATAGSLIPMALTYTGYNHWVFGSNSHQKPRQL
jgi:putative flippase GtrA